jgi:hypothetical protein
VLHVTNDRGAEITPHGVAPCTDYFSGVAIEQFSGLTVENGSYQR